jgi:uncharacterized membrane protein
MERMLARDARMMDGQVIGSLQNGTAFFASTSLIALGGAVALFRSTEDMLTVFAALPFGEPATHIQWELKVVGLMIIFIYAVFNFAWAYRLYNYVAIMVGAAPPASEQNTPEAKAYAETTATVITDAGRHFNRGQRALFFALGYLGWFLGPWPLIATTAGILVVQWRRQFASLSRRAVHGPWLWRLNAEGLNEPGYNRDKRSKQDRCRREQHRERGFDPGAAGMSLYCHLCRIGLKPRWHIERHHGSFSGRSRASTLWRKKVEITFPDRKLSACRMNDW